MQKKVYIISDHNLWYGNTAAVSRMNLYAKALVHDSEDIKVYLVSVQNFNKETGFIQIEKNIYVQEHLENTYHFKKNVSRILVNLRFGIQFNKIIPKHNENDVFLIYPSINLSFTLFVFLLLKINKSKQIFFEVNEIRNYLLNKPIKSIKDYIIHNYIYLKIYLYEKIWAYSQGLICISKNIVKYVHKINKNTIVVPILSDVDKSIRLTKKTHIKFTVLFSGYVSIRKENIDVFLKALEKLNTVITVNWEFILCGKIDLIDKLFIDKFIRDTNLISRVRYLGDLSNSEVLKLQSEASLLVLPRKNNLQNYYGFSTKLAEYAVSGTPVLMTNTGVVSDYFKDNYNCYMVDGYACDDFYNKLLYIINQSEDQKRKISENAYQTAVKYFNYLNYSDTLRNFLQLDN